MPRYFYPLKAEETAAIKCAGVVNGKIKSPKGHEVPCSEKALCLSVGGQFYVVEPGGYCTVDFSIPEKVVKARAPQLLSEEQYEIQKAELGIVDPPVEAPKPKKAPSSKAQE